MTKPEKTRRWRVRFPQNTDKAFALSSTTQAQPPASARRNAFRTNLRPRSMTSWRSVLCVRLLSDRKLENRGSRNRPRGSRPQPETVDRSVAEVEEDAQHTSYIGFKNGFFNGKAASYGLFTHFSYMHHFRYTGPDLHCESVDLAAVAKLYGTPTYVYSAATMADNYRRLQQALAGLDAQICYAAKANSNLAVVRHFANLGAGFDHGQWG